MDDCCWNLEILLCHRACHGKSQAMPTTLLRVSCPDRVGLLARISSFAAQHGGNLKEVHQFTDSEENWFCARMEIDTPTLTCDLRTIRNAFEPLGRELNAEWSIRPAELKPRVVLMVSKLGHCLADLLWRWRSGEVAFEIPCVISNHETLRDLVEREGSNSTTSPSGLIQSRWRSIAWNRSGGRVPLTSWCSPGTCRLFPAMCVQGGAVES